MEFKLLSCCSERTELNILCKSSTEQKPDLELEMSRLLIITNGSKLVKNDRGTQTDVLSVTNRCHMRNLFKLVSLNTDDSHKTILTVV